MKNTLKKVMTRAWEIKKENTNNLFSLCLGMAWAEAHSEIVRVENMIKEYGITLDIDGSRIYLGNVRQSDAKTIELIKNNKSAIVDLLKSKKAAEDAKCEARQAKVNAIEGLSEIKNAISAWNKYHREFNRRMENEYLSSSLPAVPQANVAELKTQYPKANAFLMAESYSFANNSTKANAGKKALEAIISGKSYKKAIATMEREWSEYAEANMWN